MRMLIKLFMPFNGYYYISDFTTNQHHLKPVMIHLPFMLNKTTLEMIMAPPMNVPAFGTS